MIVFTGATGQLGRLVIDAVLQRGVPAQQVVAAVREPQKASALAALGVQIREADYDRPDTLTHAFDGADKVLQISGSEVGRRVPQHKAVVDAAKTARAVVGRVAGGIAPPGRVGPPHCCGGPP
ncbi:NAD(P)H-binding protein [Saccharopolyspora sp. NPDC000995]